MLIRSRELLTRPNRALIIVACLVLTTVFQSQTEEPLTSLSDAELITLLHRQDARNELQRRLETYSPEKRDALRVLLENPHTRKKFPRDYPDEELYAYLHKPDDSSAYWKAQDELAQRFLAASPERQRQYVSRFRQELLAVPYPENEALDAQTQQQVHHGLTLAMGKILPEADAVDIFYDAYISNERYGGISRFLRAVEAAQVCGPSTARKLETLYEHVSVLDQRAREELGEWQGDDWPSLESMIVARLPCCGSEGFRVLCGIDWKSSPAAILAMGAVGTPEARDLLVELYELTPPEQYSRTLLILRGISMAQAQSPDITTRMLLHSELLPLLHLPEDMLLLQTCADAAGIAALSRDRDFLVPLRQLLSEFEEADSRGFIHLDANEDTLRRIRQSIEESLHLLETAIRLVPLNNTTR